MLYADAAEAIVARKLGKTPDRLALDFPTVEDGAQTHEIHRRRGRILSERQVGRLPAGALSRVTSVTFAFGSLWHHGPKRASRVTIPARATG